ncbi:hypothetical protein KAT21_00135 [Candidatus Bathyarchaeota archaeon]|nr:hypothetical protein [Candidatus Bathyarchaeota archaeon]
METEILVSTSQSNCKHRKYGRYTQRKFDMLNGFEIIAARCCKCYKILELKIAKLTSPS